MGVYDTIYFPCPNCGEEICAQSKSGPCVLDVFSADKVPLDVAQNANRHAPFKCCKCGKLWEFVNIPECPISVVKLEIGEVKK